MSASGGCAGRPGGGALGNWQEVLGEVLAEKENKKHRIPKCSLKCFLPKFFVGLSAGGRLFTYSWSFFAYS